MRDRESDLGQAELGPELTSAAHQVSCHFPVTVQVTGRLGDGHLDRLAAHVERAVAERIAAADRELSAHVRGRAATLPSPALTVSGARGAVAQARPGPPAGTRRRRSQPAPRPRRREPTGHSLAGSSPPAARHHAQPLRTAGIPGPAGPGPIAKPVPGFNKIGFIDNSDGANINTGPRESGGQALRPAPLPPATQVFVSGTYPHAPHWLYVTAVLPAAPGSAQADDAQVEIVRGYVQDFRVITDLPEPLAKLYQVKYGDTAEGLARQMYHTAIRDGHDLRYYENVLLYVNNQRHRAGVRGTYQDPGLFGGGTNNVQLLAGHRIWLVSPAFARTLEDIVPSGSLTGGAVAKARRFARRIEDILDSIADSPDYAEEVAGEYWRAIRDHLVEIIGIIAAFLAAEAASIIFAATPGGQLIAALIQLALSAFGVVGAAQAGAEAVKHASEWLTLAWNASGNTAQIAAASKEFLRMLVSIAMAALAYTGARANLAKAVEVVSSLPPGAVPALTAVRSTEHASGTVGEVPQEAANTVGGGETPSAPPTKPPTLKPSVLLQYVSKDSFMNAMRRELRIRRASGKPSLLDFLLDGQGEWQKGSVVTKTGKTIRGRYALSNPDAQLVQAGHLQSEVYARAVGHREYLMLEDADLNWLTGQTGEAKGAYLSKPAVMIDDFPVDIPTARVWESHGLLPVGTVDAAPVIEPPEW